MMYLLIGIFHLNTFEYLPALETEEPDLWNRAELGRRNFKENKDL
jgi:hypothetical protein